MVAHVAGDAGGPPPPPPNEVKLLTEIARLSTQLDAARRVITEVRDHLANDQYPCGFCADRVGAYDKTIEGMKI